MASHEMILECLPPKATARCEWQHIAGFVSHFNDTHGKSYALSTCLDVVNRAGKEPEALLVAPGETPMVIERKSVGLDDHFRDHGNEHIFRQAIFERLRNSFNDALYLLSVHERHLHGKKKREVEKFAEQIADTILSKIPLAKSPRGIEGDGWNLGRTAPDDDTPSCGIGVEISGGWIFDFTTNHSETLREESGYDQSFQSIADNAAQKFVKYADHLKILLVEFYGGFSITVDLSDDDIREIIQYAPLPALIDQVWVAKGKWVGLNDYAIEWERVR